MTGAESAVKKKIGYWLPFRPEMTSVSYDAPGFLVSEVRNSFLKMLGQGGEAELVEIIDFRDALIENGKPKYPGADIEALDGFVWFGDIGSDARREYNLELLKSITKKSKVFNSPTSYETAMDKYLTSTTLAQNSVRVPPFLLAGRHNSMQAVEILKSWGGEALLKPRLGGYGIGIVRIRKPEDLVDFLDYAQPGAHYLEKLIPNDPATWVGINIIGGEHAYSYRKGPESFHDGWKVMDRKRIGGKMLLATPSSEQLAIAKKAVKAIGASWAGVDMITDSEGNHFVIDVNAFPGLYPDMIAASGNDIPKMMADAVLRDLGV